MTVKFGPAGNPDSFYAQGHKSSLDMPAWLKELGLNAYEYQCSRGVNIGEETARKLGELARENGITLSIHAPYYINLATVDPGLRQKTKGYILNSMRAAQWMGANRVVFHPGSADKQDRPGSLNRARELLREILNEARKIGLAGIKVAPETMGKPSQLGNLEEVLEFCTVDEMVIPTVDFGHLHAAGRGALGDKKAFGAVLDRVEEKLGPEILKSLHIHFSPVEFTAAGEKKHRTTRDEGYGPDFLPLAELILERGLTPTIICESAGLQAEDALVFKGILEKLARG